MPLQCQLEHRSWEDTKAESKCQKAGPEETGEEGKGDSPKVPPLDLAPAELLSSRTLSSHVAPCRPPCREVFPRAWCHSRSAGNKGTSVCLWGSGTGGGGEGGPTKLPQLCVCKQGS